jgi:membrane associated rhomboid family serine protease
MTTSDTLEPNPYRRAQAQRRELNAALRQRQPHAFGTWLLLAANVALYIPIAIAAGRTGRFPSKLLIDWGALFPPNVADGEWWRLFTAAFLHVHALHLAFNMVALALVGPVVERLLGTRAFLIFYVAAALVGNALSLWMHPITPSAGASGAIMGLYGLLLALMFERGPSTPLASAEQAAPVSRPLLHVHLQGAVSMIATTLLFGWFDRRADNAAHIGGFLAGCLFGWMAGGHIEWRRPAERVAGIAIAVALGCCAVSLAMHRPMTDVRPLLVEVLVVDSRAMTRYSELTTSRADAAAVKRVLEGEIASAFANQRAKLDAITAIPRDQAALMSDLRRYLTLREAYWRQRAAATGRTDDPTLGQADDTDRAADAVMRRLLQAR